MKKIKKLKLNKEKVSNLNRLEMTHLKGGTGDYTTATGWYCGSERDCGGTQYPACRISFDAFC
jgi:natural product precursor